MHFAPLQGAFTKERKPQSIGVQRDQENGENGRLGDCQNRV